MTEEKNVPLGLTPVRTMRLVSSLIALTGMVFLLFERVLSAVLAMASDGIRLGLARYNTLTGRMAIQNFPEDRQLLKLLKDVNSILPGAETALTVLLVVAVVLLVVAVAGLAFPRQFAHILVALKILKWETGEVHDGRGAASIGEALAKIGNVPLKKIAIPLGVVAAVLLAVLAVSSCRDKMKSSSAEEAVGEMQKRATSYIEAQRSYFAQKKAVGGAKSLRLPDSLSTESFTYKVSATRFVATSNMVLGNCPAGSKWSVSASVKGFFDKELQLYRAVPKDSACAKLTPDFKGLGRK